MQQRRPALPLQIDLSLNRRFSAFTLFEVLVVIAIVAILAGLLLPGLSAAKVRSKQIGCVNNLKQVALGVQMYAADNDGRLPENPPPGGGGNSWISGNMQSREDTTNQSLIRQGKLFAYANNTALYRCPADLSQQGNLAHVRSYSMNSWIGSRFMGKNSSVAYRTFLREDELCAARPAMVWVLMDEHEATIDDGWFWVTMDDKKPFVSSPATRHQRGYCLNFADGHAGAQKLLDPNSSFIGQEHPYISPNNSDWLQLKQMTTVR